MDAGWMYGWMGGVMGFTPAMRVRTAQDGGRALVTVGDGGDSSSMVQVASQPAGQPCSQSCRERWRDGMSGMKFFLLLPLIVADRQTERERER